MQNWILFQTVTNSDGEFRFERNKKLKSQENLNAADELLFYKIKIFLMKNSF